MPGKKKGKGKKGGKKTKAAKLQAAEEREDAVRKTKNFLRAYPTYCAASGSVPSGQIISSCKECLEEESALTKFVLESLPDYAAKSASARSRKPSSKPASATTKLLVPAISQPQASASEDLISPPSPTPPPLVIVQPLFKALTESVYTYMRCLHVWGVNINDDGVVSIALFLELPLGSNLKVLELRNTSLTPWAMVRLSRPLARVQLTQLNLDYNEITHDVLVKLCDKLQANPCLQTLSLNYCKLDHTCGDTLGAYITMSQIKSLSLVGNSLQCNGCNDLFRPLVSICESSSFNAIKMDADVRRDEELLSPAEAARRESVSSPRGSRGESSKGGTSLGKVAILPPLSRLDLRDNAIDAHGKCGDEEQTFEPVVCMRTIKRWMTSAPGIEDLNLDHNLIGDGGARELLQGLILRKEAGFPIMKLWVTVYISQETFQKIVEYSSTGKKKKGGKGKKKKK